MEQSQAPRSPEDVRRFFAAWIGSSNAGDWNVFAEFMHADIVLDDPLAPEPARGRAAALARAKAQYEPFPDARLDMIGDPFVSLEEPELAFRWRFVGTHLRAIEPQGLAPTGRRTEIEGASVLRFRDQQVVEVRVFFDAADAARQALAVPRAGSPLERVVVLSQRLRAAWSRRESS